MSNARYLPCQVGPLKFEEGEKLSQRGSTDVNEGKEEGLPSKGSIRKVRAFEEEGQQPEGLLLYHTFCIPGWRCLLPRTTQKAENKGKRSGVFFSPVSISPAYS